MKNHEAMAEAIGPNAQEHAKAHRKSTSLMYKWCEPHTDFSDSGTLNPVDRLQITIDTALACGRPEEKALAPIECLANRYKRVLLEIPEAPTSVREAGEMFARTLGEFSQLANEWARAIEDGRISTIEAERIETEVWDAIRQCVAFLFRVRETVKA